MLATLVFAVVAGVSAVAGCVPAASIESDARAATTPQGTSGEEFVTVRVRATILDGRFDALSCVGFAVVEQLDGSLKQALAEPLGESDALGKCSFDVPVPLPADGRRWVFGGRGLATQARRLGPGRAEVDLGAFAMGRGSTAVGGGKYVLLPQVVP
ncbi:MAG: hypothetical protein AB8H80_21675 [Planctomycetota bacterium]